MEVHPDHRDDVALIRRALTGTVDARRELAQRLSFVPRAMAGLNRRSGGLLGREDLEDATQDVLTSIWRRLASYEGRSALESWAFRFCLNVLSERRRSWQRRPKHVELEAQDSPTNPSAAIEAEFAPIYRALDRLEPRTEAEMVRLKHFGGLTFEALGARHGISVSTVKTRYYRGLRKLREALEPLRREGVL